MPFDTDIEAADRPLLINNVWQAGSGGEWLPILNPVDESVIGRHAVATIADLDMALASAQIAFESWRDVGPLARAQMLRAAAALILDRADSLAKALTREQGKPLAQARMEIEGCARAFDWAAEEGRRTYGRVIPSNVPGLNWSAGKYPIGPVAAFTPWNFPASQAAAKIGSAIAAGCSIILKGPEDAPTGCVGLAQALVDAGLPPGVFNLVFGRPPEISEHLIASPIIRKISFTGSVPVGKHLAGLAAAQMKPCTMELGGHAPVLVFGDVDPVATAKIAAAGKFRNAGQVCVSPTRFMVHASIYEPFVETFVATAQALKVGDGLDPATEMGPLANDRRLAAVEAVVADALAQGARLRTGGSRIGNVGYFHQPTVLTDVPETARVLHEEPFGPIAVISPFADREAAMAQANATAYGLAAYAFTGSQVDAAFVAKRFESGMVGINTLGIGGAEGPFGGVKESGYGREGGTEGIEAYLTTKLVALMPV
ncbi:NAD-dependent succinate-semialdehyde dehydrogenase [Phenylobacterium aquaticum]|uniref:NAD-dependent succinate-semialdehyde dehydrogenase n=1 Tax=Phenylobacterium aquaticum TaxID=1763816 RepID=UPI0026F19E1A|nr:NAD-dependent succinate-semialdehyde dehydrogenase [Phenylobacterium aquaticum]